MIENRLRVANDGEKYVEGYFLTVDELAKFVRDFQVDCHDGFVSNDKSYIENWLKNKKI